MGAVAEGKIADLVVLDADPLEAIANTRRISMVVSRGIVRDHAALDALLAEAKREVARGDAEAARAALDAGL